MGSRFWSRKTDEIQGLVDELKPQICFISEANLFGGLAPHLSQIEGYDLITTKSMESKKYSRLVLLIESGVKVELQEQWMDDTVASIWLKLKRRGCPPVTIGGIYRQHSLPLQGIQNTTDSQEAQTARWKKCINQWVNAGQGANCHVIGDINLDIFKWGAPDQINEEMVNLMKEEIQTLNFQQLVNGATRFWPSKADSLIDHFWTNRPDRILSVRNIPRAAADHNAIEVTIKNQGDRHR